MPPQPLSLRPTYALPALRTYFSHIRLPASHQQSLVQNVPKHDPLHGITPTSWGTSTAAIEALVTLQKYQQAAIPFSNLYLHYSSYHRGTPLDHESTWRYLIKATPMVGGPSSYLPTSSSRQEEIMNIRTKTIGEISSSERESIWHNRPASGGRGGTCTINNGFFGTVMRSLGMEVMCTGARVSMGYGGNKEGEGRFAGWNHAVNLVGCEGRWWLVDVGFGGDGPTAPLELIDGAEMPWGNTSSRVRLIHASIPEFTDPSSKIWILQHLSPSSSSTGSWKDLYCFATTEFLPQDIAVMNFKTTGDVRGSFFNHMVICQRTILEEESGDVVGTLGLVGGKVKKRVWMEEEGWSTEVVADCKNEIERREVLEKWFGIVLGEEERRGIRGLVSELKGERGD